MQFSVSGSSGSRDVIYPIPGGGLLGERPVVPGGRERTEREEQMQCQIESDAAQGPVVKAKKGSVSQQAWMSGTGIWLLDMLNIEDGVHSALLAKERVRLIHGWKHRETMGIQNFTWITLSWAEKPRTERRQFCWASSQKIVG